MFIIKWRNRLRSKTVVTGISRYPTKEAAETQIARWQAVFPANSYYLEPSNA